MVLFSVHIQGLFFGGSLLEGGYRVPVQRRRWRDHLGEKRGILGTICEYKGDIYMRDLNNYKMLYIYQKRKINKKLCFILGFVADILTLLSVTLTHLTGSI